MITNIDLLDSIRKKSNCHQRGTTWFNQTEIGIMNAIKKLHGIGISEVFTLGEIGNLNFPYFKMGNVDSVKLFGIDELIIFSFYYRPSTGLLIIKLLLLVSIFIICTTYLKKIEYWLINKNLWMIGSISISLFYLMPLFMGNQILGINSGSILISKSYITLLVFIIFLISLILILWIRNSYRKIHKKTLLNNEFITKKLFLISSQLIEFLSSQIIE